LGSQVHNAEFAPRKLLLLPIIVLHVLVA
jgi:hypothetical protein